MLRKTAGREEPDWDADPLVSQTALANDKGIGWTASATGIFFAGLLANGGAGAATLSVEVVGTAIGRSATADTTGAAVSLAVACDFATCSYQYGGGPMLDGDGAGFELLLQALQGVGYALAVDLVGTTAAEVHLKTYYPGNVAGAGAYTEVLSGALGDWICTPGIDWMHGPGHHSYAMHHGCADEDRSCWNAPLNAPLTFGYNPGASFGTALRATWAAPAAGVVLLRVAANCDVQFFADVEAEGCSFSGVGGATYGCGLTADMIADGSSSNGHCNADLTLAITAGAHYINRQADGQGGGRRLQRQNGADASAIRDPGTYGLVAGPAVREVSIEMSRDELEGAAAALFATGRRRQLQRLAGNEGTGAIDPGTYGLTTPPTLDEMLVTGSPAAGLLSALFTSQQQTHLAFPTAIEPLGSAVPVPGDGHRRALQRQDGAVDRVSISIKATAPTVEESEGTVARLQALATTGRRVLEGASSSTRKLQAVRCIDGVGLSDSCQRAAECIVGMSASCVAAATEVITISTIEIGRSDVEALAAAGWQAAVAGRRRLQRVDGSAGTTRIDPGTYGLSAPPTLDDMLVPGSPAADLLASLFTVEQQPHLAFPTSVEPLGSMPGTAPGNPACWSGEYTYERCCLAALGPTGDARCWSRSFDYAFCCAGSGGRRALQRQDGAVDRVSISIKATAPTVEESEGTVARLQALATTGR